MATFLSKRNRSVIPRWRDFRSTVDLGELSASSLPHQSSKNIFDLSALTKDWSEHSTLAVAGDLLSAAQVSGQSELAVEAATFVLAHQSGKSKDSLLTRLAKSVLGQDLPDCVTPSGGLEDASTVRPRIAAARNLLKNNPRDAIRWVDLSLLYINQGLHEKAKRTMQVALTIAPMNRFVLRSAARLFIHLGDIDQARDLLRRSPLSKIDPWIASAEIAVATAAGHTPLSVNAGLQMLRMENSSPSDTTELSTALATLEFHSGNLRNARRFIKQGLVSPNENSLAQAKWIAGDITGNPIEINVDEFHIPRAFEAASWQAFVEQDWITAAQRALQWLRDQPFSSRPAIIAAYISSTLLEDYVAAEKITKLGQIANPNEHSFHISLAFVYGSTGRTQEALEELTRIKGPLVNSIYVAVPANYGLIAFRENNLDLGRKQYEEAVSRADLLGEESLKAQALMFWAREEIRSGTENASAILSRAADAVKVSPSLEAKFILSRIESTLSKKGPRTS